MIWMPLPRQTMMQHEQRIPCTNLLSNDMDAIATANNDATQTAHSQQKVDNAFNHVLLADPNTEERGRCLNQFWKKQCFVSTTGSLLRLQTHSSIEPWRDVDGGAFMFLKSTLLGNLYNLLYPPSLLEALFTGICNMVTHKTSMTQIQWSTNEHPVGQDGGTQTETERAPQVKQAFESVETI